MMNVEPLRYSTNLTLPPIASQDLFAKLRVFQNAIEIPCAFTPHFPPAPSLCRECPEAGVETAVRLHSATIRGHRSPNGRPPRNRHISFPDNSRGICPCRA